LGSRVLLSSLRLKTLVRGPGVNEGAIDAKVLDAGQAALLGIILDTLEKGAGQAFVEKALAVGALKVE
jgi:hypothetical protein